MKHAPETRSTQRRPRCQAAASPRSVSTQATVPYQATDTATIVAITGCLVITAIAAAAALIGGVVGYSLGSPVPNLVFAPPNPSLPADAPIGTFVALVIVTMSDGSVFKGFINFGVPYGDAQGCFAIRDRTIVLACQLPSLSAVRHITITAMSSQ